MNYKLIPHVTEKSHLGAGEANANARTFTFVISKGMSKEMVKKLVEKEFKVSVVDVRTIHLPGKVRRFKGVVGHTQIIRKALVRLKPGENISAFDLPTQADNV